MCEGKNCDKTPSFNYAGTKTPIYCIGCALPGMIDVKNPQVLCGCEGCSNPAIYKLEGPGPFTFCRKHKTSEMVNLYNCLYIITHIIF